MYLYSACISKELHVPCTDSVVVSIAAKLWHGQVVKVFFLA